MYFVAVIAVLLSVGMAKPDADLVQSIPNVGAYMTDYNFAVYSGYLDVTGTQKKLHYVFT